MSLEKSFEPTPAAVYLLVHKEGPRREGTEALVVKACLPHIGLAAFNHTTFRAVDKGLDALATARTLPMMADRRLVVVRHIQEASNDFFVGLLAYLEDPSPSTTLVLSAPEFPKVVKGSKRWSTKVRKAVDKAGGFALDPKAKTDPAKFAMSRAKRAGKSMTPGAARLLVESVGENIGPIEMEVAKLVDFVGDAEAIDESHVGQVTALVAEAVVFDLTHALVSRDRNATLANLQRLLSDGQDPRYLLAMITWKMRGVALAAEAMAEGVPDNAISKAAGLRFDEYRRLKPALKSGVGASDAIVARLAKANLDMNSHRAGDRRILERLVIDWLM